MKWIGDGKDISISNKGCIVGAGTPVESLACQSHKQFDLEILERRMAWRWPADMSEHAPTSLMPASSELGSLALGTRLAAGLLLFFGYCGRG